MNVISEEGTEEGAEAVINTEPELAQQLSHLRHYWKPVIISPCQQEYWRTRKVKWSASRSFLETLFNIQRCSKLLTSKELVLTKSFAQPHQRIVFGT